jgi:hypothetical protein
VFVNAGFYIFVQLPRNTWIKISGHPHLLTFECMDSSLSLYFLVYDFLWVFFNLYIIFFYIFVHLARNTWIKIIVIVIFASTKISEKMFSLRKHTEKKNVFLARCTNM